MLGRSACSLQPGLGEWQATHDAACHDDIKPSGCADGTVWARVQMAKIDKFTKAQLSTLKKRVKSLREQVKDVKEGEGNSQLTQVRAALCIALHRLISVTAG